ncbi:hypothetical protein GCM10010388_00940 [Streptomyces mauvecolor]
MWMARPGRHQDQPVGKPTSNAHDEQAATARQMEPISRRRVPVPTSFAENRRAPAPPSTGGTGAHVFQSRRGLSDPDDVDAVKVSETAIDPCKRADGGQHANAGRASGG